MGSDENRFNVSVESEGQSHKSVSTNHNLSEEKGEPKRYRTEVLLLTSQASLTAKPNWLTSSPHPPPRVYIYIINNSNMVGVFRYELGNTNKEEEKSIFTGA